MFVFFTKRAAQTIYKELHLYPDLETGGVLFGVHIKPVWIVFAITSSGKKSLRTESSFEMSSNEISQEAADIMRGEHLPVWMVGIWHNNDGSTDMFDDGIPDDLLDVIREGKLNAESCLQTVETYYEGDSDLENGNISTASSCSASSISIQTTSLFSSPSDFATPSIYSAAKITYQSFSLNRIPSSLPALTFIPVSSRYSRTKVSSGSSPNLT